MALFSTLAVLAAVSLLLSLIVCYTPFILALIFYFFSSVYAALFVTASLKEKKPSLIPAALILMLGPPTAAIYSNCVACT